MKAREAFDLIRNQKKDIFGLRSRLTALVAAEILVSIGLALGISVLIYKFVPLLSQLPPILVILVLSLAIAITITAFISKIFFKPIKELRLAMEKVADGDLSVQIETKSSLKEIQEVYSGFNLMTHELRATEILQTDFVSNVSHEFKTPINAIEGYSMLLQGGDNLTDEQKEYIDKIIFNTSRLSGLMSSILLLSKIENQSINTNQVKYRLDEQIRQSIVAAEPAWSAKDIEFDVDMENIEYIGSENLMRHVWNNLIGNAIKFDPHGGYIKIRLYTTDESIVFTVEDNGPGISKEAQKHIFDKFYQADSSHKDEGNGLGLSLVKKILSLCSGEILVKNIESGGCQFTVVLKSK